MWQLLVEHPEKSCTVSGATASAHGIGMPLALGHGMASKVWPTLWKAKAPVSWSVIVVFTTWHVAHRRGFAAVPWLLAIWLVSYAKPGGIQPTFSPSTSNPCAPWAPRDEPVPVATDHGGVPLREWQVTHSWSRVGVDSGARSCAS